MTLAFNVPASSSTSWLRRLDARWKLAGVFMLAVATIIVTGGGAAFVSAVLAIALARSAGVTAKQLASRLVPLVLMLALLLLWPVLRVSEGELFWNVYGVLISQKALRILLVVICKAAAIVTLAATLVDTTPLHELGQGAAGLGVPRFFVHLVLLTHRYVQVLSDEFGRLRRALRVRGFKARGDRRSLAVVGNVAGMIFVRGHERAERVHHAMAARGFDGRFRSLSSPRTSLADIAFFAGALLVAVTLIAGDGGWLGR